MSTPPPFDLGDGPPRRPIGPPPTLQQTPGTLARWRARGGFLGGLASVGILLLKLAPILKLGFLLKGFVTLGSMLVSMWAYSTRYGWPMGIGFVLMIFVHECGHALAARRFKLPYAGMLFIPFLGGVVFHRKGNTTVVQDAFVGIMGPFVGTLYGLVCHAAYLSTGHAFWLHLAQWTYFVNLFNLAFPLAPFDGHWIAAVFSKRSGASTEERRNYALGWAGLGAFLLLMAVGAGRALHGG